MICFGCFCFWSMWFSPNWLSEFSGIGTTHCDVSQALWPCAWHCDTIQRTLEHLISSSSSGASQSRISHVGCSSKPSPVWSLCQRLKAISKSRCKLPHGLRCCGGIQYYGWTSSNRQAGYNLWGLDLNRLGDPGFTSPGYYQWEAPAWFLFVEGMAVFSWSKESMIGRWFTRKSSVLGEAGVYSAAQLLFSIQPSEKDSPTLAFSLLVIYKRGRIRGLSISSLGFCAN